MTYKEEIVICDRCKISRLVSQTVLMPGETGMDIVCNICEPPVVTATQNQMQYIDISKFSPTKADVADLRNVEIAIKMFGMVACDGWSYMNFGSARKFREIDAFELSFALQALIQDMGYKQEYQVVGPSGKVFGRYTEVAAIPNTTDPDEMAADIDVIVVRKRES